MHTHAACSHAIQSVSTKNDAKEFISSLLLTQSALQLFRAVYVIFGATGGIGSDLAKRLLAADSKVILAADNGDKLSKLKEKLGGGETQEIDVMNSKQVCCFPCMHHSSIHQAWHATWKCCIYTASSSPYPILGIRTLAHTHDRHPTNSTRWSR